MDGENSPVRDVLPGKWDLPLRRQGRCSETASQHIIHSRENVERSPWVRAAAKDVQVFNSPLTGAWGIHAEWAGICAQNREWQRKRGAETRPGSVRGQIGDQRMAYVGAWDTRITLTP